MSIVAEEQSYKSTMDLVCVARLHTQLTEATAGLIYQWAYTRFKARILADQAHQHGNSQTHFASDLTAYVLRTELEMPVSDVAKLTGRPRRRINEMVQRIIDSREEDQALSHWLDDVSNALKGAAQSD